MSYSNLKLFALSSNQELAQKVADIIGIPLGKSSVRQFSDGEIQVNIEESIRGHHVFILQSTSSPVNDNLMEILIMVDALKRASAETVSVVMPYYGYANHHDIITNQAIAIKILSDKRCPHQMIDRNIEKSLDLCCVEINRQQTINACNLQHIGYKFRCDRLT